MEEKHLTNLIYVCEVLSLVRKYNSYETAKGQAESREATLENYRKLLYVECKDT